VKPGEPSVSPTTLLSFVMIERSVVKVLRRCHFEMAEAVILITLWLLWSMSSIRRRQIRHCGVFGLSAAATPTSSAERPPVDGQEQASKFTPTINLKTAQRSGGLRWGARDRSPAAIIGGAIASSAAATMACRRMTTAIPTATMGTAIAPTANTVPTDLKIFRSPPQKGFRNNIDPKRTFERGRLHCSDKRSRLRRLRYGYEMINPDQASGAAR
jgi:hypothetical protein